MQALLEYGISDMSYLYTQDRLKSIHIGCLKLIHIFHMDFMMQTCREIKAAGFVCIFNTNLMSINYGL